MKTVYYNGVVYTGEMPLQQAFCVEDGLITFVGNDDNMPEGDQYVDLKGKFVCSGFNDSHMHLLNFGQALSVAPLHQHTSSLEDLISCMKKMQPGRGGWILGRGWNQDLFKDEKRMPNRYDLDCVSNKCPVCAVRACGHALVVNSKALEMLGITSDTKSPDGGEICMDDGEPNGIFFDNAMDLVLLRIPAPEKAEVKQMIRKASKSLNAYGITSCHSDDYCVFHNMPWQTVNEAFQELEQAGELSVRVYEQANFTKLESLQGFLDTGCMTGVGNRMFRVGPLKLLGDGALGARTAYLSKPYEDAPETQGLSVFTKEEFDSLIGCANSHGMQVAVHAIGDGCLDLVLDCIEKSLMDFPRADHRHGIVHCQITRPDQLEKMEQMGLHIYAQSIFLDYDIHMVETRVGKHLASSSYSWKWLMDHGCTVSNGSDCPVELPNVMAGIQCAVTRCDLKGIGPYLPDQAFTVQQALDSFTKAGAWASYEEDIKGCLKPGMVADFVILEESPFETNPCRLKDIRIVQTVLAGKPVYSA